MRILLSTILALSLTGCANKRANFDTGNLELWMGQHSSVLISSWGQPYWEASTLNRLVWLTGNDAYMFWTDDRGILSHWSVDKASVWAKVARTSLKAAAAFGQGYEVQATQANQKTGREKLEEMRQQEVNDTVHRQEMKRKYGVDYGY